MGRGAGKAAAAVWPPGYDAQSTCVRYLPPLTPGPCATTGASSERPENTVIAFQHCIDLGGDVNELDLYRTVDGALVVFHDSTLDRTTNGTGPVATKTLAELKTLDAGYRFTTDGGRTYPYRGQGITIPTIAEVIEQVRGGRFNIDMKSHDNATARALADEIRQLGAEDRVIVGSFDDATVRAFREFAPGVTTLASLVEVRHALSVAPAVVVAC
jgi:glycerophosphoryl diester phosphodiesterase